uniref:SRS domain-containing protein n=1 Tax=Neospora caninum (strain Liverpool) TaxID=572307 RepID=F0JB63_NEOCL|nr:SRS domain-containing protein [Neospora caninum Liverpool]CEL71330.1 TPA: SRS domain-containing protein [Neospora caninum Liverpool]
MAETGVVRRPWRMAGAPFVVFVALMSSTLQEVQGQAEAAPPNTCSNQTLAKGISVSVDQNKKAVSFVCGADLSQVLPSPEEEGTATECYTKNNLSGEKTLVELFGPETQATVSPPTAGSSQQPSTVALTLGKLPERTTIIYFACTAATGVPGGGVPGGVPGAVPGKIGAVTATNAVENKCVVTVTVPADPAANITPTSYHLETFDPFFLLIGGRVCHCTRGCYSPMSAACTVAKQNMDLEITSESKSVSFQCDTNIDRLNPENTADLIFDESCQKSVNLAAMLPSAKLATSTSGYTLSVEELPETAATFCYKCSAAAAERNEVPEEGSNACNVKIHVSAADLDSAASSVATTGSVPLLTSGLAISFLVLPAVF